MLSAIVIQAFIFIYNERKAIIFCLFYASEVPQSHIIVGCYLEEKKKNHKH